MEIIKKLANQEVKNKIDVSKGHGHKSLWITKKETKKYIKNYLLKNKTKLIDYKNSHSKSLKFPYQLKIKIVFFKQNILNFLQFMWLEIENQDITKYKQSNKKKQNIDEVKKSIENEFGNSIKKEFIGYIQPNKFDSKGQYQFRIPFHETFIWEHAVPYTCYIILKHDEINDIWFYKIKLDFQYINENPFLKKNTKIIKIKKNDRKTDFRTKLLKKWNNKCVISKLKCEKLLEAAHIKSVHFIKKYDKENKKDINNINNGLILNVIFHKLFDIGFITFNHQNGELMISKSLKQNYLKDFDLLKKQIISNKIAISQNSEISKFLKHHNEKVFIGFVFEKKLKNNNNKNKKEISCKKTKINTKLLKKNYY